MDELSKTEPQSAPKFAADRMLARLARWLRLLGADVLFDPSVGGAELLARARSEGRVTLTRDKRLRTAPDAFRMGRAPIDPAASRTAGEALLARIDEGRHTAHDRIALGLGERIVAV